MIEKEKLLNWLNKEADEYTSTDDRSTGYHHAIEVIKSGEFDTSDEWEKRFEIAFENNVRYISENKQLEKQNKWLKKQIKEYERTLKWYANSQHYHILDHHGYLAVENDEGSQARNIIRRWNER